MGDLLAAILDLIWGIFKADQTLAEESRYGASTEQQASRRSCQWGCVVMLVTGIILAAVWKKWE